jgi:hypothetical protein
MDAKGAKVERADAAMVARDFIDGRGAALSPVGTLERAYEILLLNLRVFASFAVEIPLRVFASFAVEIPRGNFLVLVTNTGVCPITSR